MNGRVRHKFDRLKKLARQQKTDIFSISIPAEDIATDALDEHIAAKDEEVFTVHQSIEVKKTE